KVRDTKCSYGTPLHWCDKRTEKLRGNVAPKAFDRIHFPRVGEKGRGLLNLGKPEVDIKERGKMVDHVHHEHDVDCYQERTSAVFIVASVVLPRMGVKI